MIPLPAFLASVVRAIRTAISNHLARHRADEALLAVLWHRAGRVGERLAQLHALWQQGRLKPTRTRTRPPRPTPDPAPPPRPRLPGRMGWFVAMVPEAAHAGGFLHAFIQRPDVPEFIAAVPRAGRLLRPLCRMQGIVPPPWLRLPPRPRKPRPRKPRPPRPRRLRPAPLSSFPPYLRRAIRAWRNPAPLPDAPAPTRTDPPRATPPPPAPEPSPPLAAWGFDTPWSARRR